jgi:hypothetical protein
MGRRPIIVSNLKDQKHLILEIHAQTGENARSATGEQPRRVPNPE